MHIREVITEEKRRKRERTPRRRPLSPTAYLVQARRKVEEANRSTPKEKASCSARLIKTATLLHSIGQQWEDGSSDEASGADTAAAAQLKQLCTEVTNAIEISPVAGSEGEPRYSAVLRAEAKAQLLTDLQRIEGLGKGDAEAGDIWSDPAVALKMSVDGNFSEFARIVRHLLRDPD